MFCMAHRLNTVARVIRQTAGLLRGSDMSRIVSVCFDCLNMYHNAELSDDAELGTVPLSKMSKGDALGSLPCGHGYDCGSCDGPSGTEYFGERCDTCHTRYAGARFDYSLVGE